MSTVLMAAAICVTTALEAAPPAGILDGKPRVLVVNGYSTSFKWPGLLQEKLDRHFGGKRILEVRKATKGGTPIAKWMDPVTGERLASWHAILKPALRDDTNRQVIVLAQQSLQWAFGDRRIGIADADDFERIQTGADFLERYAENLLEDGADLVFIAMHIYKHPMEPEIGNERLALAAFLERHPERVAAGPDVWTPTKAAYPQAFARDKLHPNDDGAEILAQAWFDALKAYASTAANPPTVPRKPKP